MFDWLEDLGEAIVDVGSDVVKNKYGTNESAKENELLTPARPNYTVATPSAYEYAQKPVTVNDNGAPVQSVSTQFSQNNMLMIGGGVLLVIALLLVVKK